MKKQVRLIKDKEFNACIARWFEHFSSEERAAKRVQSEELAQAVTRLKLDAQYIYRNVNGIVRGQTPIPECTLLVETESYLFTLAKIALNADDIIRKLVKFRADSKEEQHGK